MTQAKRKMVSAHWQTAPPLFFHSRGTGSAPYDCFPTDIESTSIHQYRKTWSTKVTDYLHGQAINSANKAKQSKDSNPCQLLQDPI